MNSAIKRISKKKNFIFKISNFLNKTFFLTFYIKELNMLFINFFSVSLKLYSNFLEKYFSINDICLKIFSNLSMVFRLRLYKYSRRVRKILKNRIKFYTSYEFIKSHRRISRVISFLKFCINLTPGHSFEDRFFNMINSIIIHNKKS